jgi:hypothetical protein
MRSFWAEVIKETPIPAGLAKVIGPNSPQPAGLDKAKLQQLKDYKLENKHPDPLQHVKDDPDLKKLVQAREQAVGELDDLQERQENSGSKDAIEKAADHVQVFRRERAGCRQGHLRGRQGRGGEDVE